MVGRHIDMGKRTACTSRNKRCARRRTTQHRQLAFGIKHAAAARCGDDRSTWRRGRGRAASDACGGHGSEAWVRAHLACLRHQRREGDDRAL